MVGLCHSLTIKWLALLLRRDPATPATNATKYPTPPLKTGIAPKLSFFCSYMCYMDFFFFLETYV